MSKEVREAIEKEHKVGGVYGVEGALRLTGWRLIEGSSFTPSAVLLMYIDEVAQQMGFRCVGGKWVRTGDGFAHAHEAWQQGHIRDVISEAVEAAEALQD